MSAKTNGHTADPVTIPEDLDFEEIKIPVPWGHISGKWWGPKTRQPIIAIHGWQDNSGTFDNLVPLLKNKKLSVLCIDLPGHGFSSHLPAGQFYYIFWDGIHFLRRIVKFFNWKSITVMGHSLGGAIAFLYAAFYPGEVDKFIQIDIATPPVYSLDRLKDIEGAGVDKFLKYENLARDTQPRYDYEEMVDVVESAHRGSLTRDSAKIMLRRGMIPDQSKTNCYIFTRDPRIKFSSLACFSREQVLNYARRIKCKVLNIRAIPGYKFEMENLYNEVLDVISENAEVVRHKIEGTHHLHLNEADKIFDCVFDFLTIDL